MYIFKAAVRGGGGAPPRPAARGGGNHARAMAAAPRVPQGTRGRKAALFAQVTGGLIGEPLAFVVIRHSGLHRLLRQDRAVDLHRRQAIQGLHHRLVGQGKRLAEGLALNHVGCNGAGGDGGGTPKGLELYVLNDLIVIDL